MSEIQQQPTLPLDNPLWQYALEVYRRPGVKSALLALQDQGYQINIILMLLWLDHQKLAIDTQMLSTIMGQSLQSVISPLREIRKHVKQDLRINDTYKSFLTLELTLEQKEIAIYYWQLNKVNLKNNDPLPFTSNLQYYCALLKKQSMDDFSPLLHNIIV